MTNKQLVDYCKKCVGREYWYGCFGNKATKDLYYRKKKQYPKYYDSGSYKKGWTCDGNPVYDCIGLIKSFIWTKGVYGATPSYSSSKDVNVGGMLDICTKKGPISTIPEVPGVLVFINRSHIGVYIGDGYVIEARGHDYGVVKTKLGSRGWTKWGYCPWIAYEGASTTTPAKKKNNYKIVKDVNVRRNSNQLSLRVKFNDYPVYIKDQILKIKKTKVDYLPVGTVVEVLDIKNGWYKIYDGMWIAGNFATKE